MNKILGRIILKETGIGIPNLLVAVYDLDPDTKPEEIFGGSGLTGIALPSQGIPGDRLGSVLTDVNGAFEFTFEDKEFQIRNKGEKRPDLFVFVLAPEEPGKGLISRILYFSTVVRQNAGRIESYLIRLAEEQLKKAGLPVPEDIPEEFETIIERMNADDQRENKIADAHRSIAEKEIEKKREMNEEIEKKREMNEEIDKKLEKFYASLSTITDEQKKKLSFVSPGDSVEEMNVEVVKAGIRNIVNTPDKRAPVRGHIRLTEEQITELRGFEDSNGKVSGDKVNEKILKNRGGREFPTVLRRQDPLKVLCQNKSDEEKCAEKALGLISEEEEDNDNIPTLLKILM
ncbi:MAG: hypothetical protein R2568_00900 [Candidatus Scalindua sp.]|nr:hypothetical protein [Candidatus Scalindua sp.]